MKSPQGQLLVNILKALFDLDSKIVHNESTFKHNFFSFLQDYNDEYEVICEKNVSEVFNRSQIARNLRLDYYLQNNTSRKQDKDVAIEFKIDCLNKDLIKHDLKKLEETLKIHKKTVAIFINVFTTKLNFSEFVRMVDLYSKTNAYVIIIAKVGMKKYYYRVRGQIYSFEPKQTVYITNSKRLKMAFYRAQHNLILPYYEKNTKIEILIPAACEKARKIKLSYYHPNPKEKDKFRKLMACEHDLRFLYFMQPSEGSSVKVNNLLPYNTWYDDECPE